MQIEPSHLLGATALLFAAVMTPAAASAQCPAMRAGPLPLQYVGPPTTAAISACDLMTRLYRFADDSMRGRRAGTVDNARATDGIAAEARRLGLQPAGDSGGYFQNLPMVTRAMDTSATIVVGPVTLHAGVDFIATTTAMRPAAFHNLQFVYGGALLDTTAQLGADVTNGRAVFFRPIAPGVDPDAIQRTAKGRDWVTWYGTIHNRVTANAAQLSPQALRNASNPVATVMLQEEGATITVTLTSSAAATLFGAPLEQLRAGAVSRGVQLNLRYIDTPRPARNVVALLRGSDPRLRNTYVVLNAHSDHIGMARGPIDHDSLRIFNQSSRAGAEGAASRKQTTEDEEYDVIHHLTDSMRRVGARRADSTFNGADDGGTGVVALLEIAESFARGAVKPKRSILFVWHTATESSPTLAGSAWFVAHATVPRDSIVAALTVDMIGRGEAKDEVGVTASDDPRHGNADFVEVLGPRRLASELSGVIAAANTSSGAALRIDDSADADAHPQGLFCRNDQASYALAGIPVALFTTGYHADYHEVTDEPQYIQYEHMARVVRLVAATTLSVANSDHVLTIDHAKPAAGARCVQ